MDRVFYRVFWTTISGPIRKGSQNHSTDLPTSFSREALPKPWDHWHPVPNRELFPLPQYVLFSATCSKYKSEDNKPHFPSVFRVLETAQPLNSSACWRYKWQDHGISVRRPCLHRVGSISEWLGTWALRFRQLWVWRLASVWIDYRWQGWKLGVRWVLRYFRQIKHSS